jgi:prophage regulatory protein
MRSSDSQLARSTKRFSPADEPETVEAKFSSTPVTIKILRLPQVCSVTGLGRTMIYRLQQSGRFPRSVKITDYAVGWVESEVQTWLAQRAAKRSSDGSRG